MTPEKKQEMLNKTVLAIVKGILPKNFNDIAPDYVYYKVNGQYVNVFLAKSISHDIVNSEVFADRNAEILEKAYSAILVLEKTQRNTTLVYSTLIDTQHDEIVGVVVSNVQILP